MLYLACGAGSSAGSASSVAARFAPWALCEDTGGSCRAPAMANGIYGIRPTLGCYNFSDALVLATFTRDTVGEFCLTSHKPDTTLCCAWAAVQTIVSQLFTDRADTRVLCKSATVICWCAVHVQQLLIPLPCLLLSINLSQQAIRQHTAAAASCLHI